MTSYLPDPLMQDVFALEPFRHVFALVPLVQPELTADPEKQESVPFPERQVSKVLTPEMQSARVRSPVLQASLYCGETPLMQLLLALPPAVQSARATRVSK
jgi:hypothetical protein